MAGTMDILIREMTIADYDQVYGLWTEIKGFGIRSIDDSREGVERFLGRNPTTSVVAGCFYPVCVAPGYRKHGIGYRMVRFAMEALQKEGVSKISLIAFKGNEVGNAFWQGIGWQEREDVNTYEFILNEENITRFVR